MGRQRGLTGRLWQAMTAPPTVRSIAAEFGPPPAVYFANELAGLDDLALIRGPQRRAPRKRGAFADAALAGLRYR